MSVVVSISSIVFGRGLPESSITSAMSFSRVWRIMKPRSGTSAFCAASIAVISPAVYGVKATRFISSTTGIMVNSVRNRARLTSTVFGGVLCMPSARRNIDSTMMIRVKAVSTISIAGARLNTVRSASTCSAEAICGASAPESRFTVTPPTLALAAAAMPGSRASSRPATAANLLRGVMAASPCLPAPLA